MSRRNRYGAWHSPWADGEASSTVDSGVAITALLESGYDVQPWEIEHSISHLRYSQEDCGGWPYTLGTQPPVVAATGWAVRCLLRAGIKPDDPSMERAGQWLIEAQCADGGWGAEPRSQFSTIGKTRDALMALHGLGVRDSNDKTLAHAREWLRQLRTTTGQTQRFGGSVGAEPQGVNPLTENIIMFLEAAFYAGIPVANEWVQADLEWLATRPCRNNAHQAVWCLSLYRKWVR